MFDTINVYKKQVKNLKVFFFLKIFFNFRDWFSGNEKMWKQAINSLQLLKKLGILEGDLEHENLRLNVKGFEFLQKIFLFFS